MTSWEDVGKRLKRIRDFFNRKNGDFHSQSLPLQPRKERGNPLEEFNKDPKRDKGK